MLEPYEKGAFLSELKHEEANANRSWTMRVGHGGFVMSFTSKFEDAMPPQHHEGAP